MRWRGRWIGYWICDCLQVPEDWPSAVFSGVHTMIWLPMLGIFNIMYRNVNVCDYTKGLHEHHKSESALEGGYGRKSTAASWSQTCISIMPDLMLNQLNYIPTPKRAYNDCDLIWFFLKRERESLLTSSDPTTTVSSTRTRRQCSPAPAQRPRRAAAVNRVPVWEWTAGHCFAPGKWVAARQGRPALKCRQWALGSRTAPSSQTKLLNQDRVNWKKKDFMSHFTLT